MKYVEERFSQSCLKINVSVLLLMYFALETNLRIG